MKTFVFALAMAGVMTASAAYAEQQPAQQTQQARTASSEAPLGRDGQDTKQFCSKQNPNIEYRDCVNAATRDPNAKVRMG